MREVHDVYEAHIVVTCLPEATARREIDVNTPEVELGRLQSVGALRGRDPDPRGVAALWTRSRCPMDYPGIPSTRTWTTGFHNITGGGIAGNLPRILPAGLDASIDLGSIQVPV